MIPVHPDTVEALQKLTPLQLAWLSGWCWAKAGGWGLGGFGLLLTCGGVFFFSLMS